MSLLLDSGERTAHEKQNWIDAAAIGGLLAGVMLVAGWLIAGLMGLIVATLAAATLLALALRAPPSLMMRLYRARIVPRDTSQLSSLLDVISYRAGLQRRPALYAIPSTRLGAFSVGAPGDAAIAVTEGLLRRLSLRDLAGVLAHEISHIKNDDLRPFAIADLATRALQLLAYLALALVALNLWRYLTGADPVSWIAIAILYLAPAAAGALSLRLPRSREFDADREAVALTGDPLGLAAAIGLLDNAPGRAWEDLMPPFPARRLPLPSLLRTHPEPEQRALRLKQLPASPDHPPLVIVEQPMVSVGFGPSEMRPRFRAPGLWF